ncbi:MAG TPA: response regulator transcription factor [Saprospiraceae bacterium]|nr:response regulator transcription factor [Saprospiraceae bacterium]MCB9270020.1 response regulator transcription factor [Lewinellaceae bacterium]HPG08437.1 response regulator transcription factor [Saprospiraceae bacterium]HPQ99588.1 response regulator transcription factor [Saprospiraceae bacterium]HQU54204.1 response regulator transcription factor [Saprospiraceae bacterium]
MIRILIADDHKIFRDGLVSLLAQEPDLQVVGQASSGQEVINQCENLPACDLVILDIHMPGMPGEAICKWIKEKYPKLPVLVLSMHDESTYILKMLEAGASGYLLKEAGATELLQAIRTVSRGDTYYSQHVSQTILHQLIRGKTQSSPERSPLTKREIEVLRLIAEEYSNQEIADKLFISIRTVDTHRTNILEKLDLKNTAGLVRYAMKNKLIDPGQ